MRLFVAAALMLSLAACSTDVRLSYTPPVNAFRSGPPVISVVNAVDQRKEAPNRLATIMGGFGNPLKILNTVQPVKDEVAAVFVQGLEARGLRQNDGRGPYRIDLTIRKFDADMIMGSTARIDIDLSLADSTGQQVYRDTASGQKSDFHFVATGVFASTEELQRLAQTLLNETVDQMLDKPALRQAISGKVTVPGVQPSGPS